MNAYATTMDGAGSVLTVAKVKQPGWWMLEGGTEVGHFVHMRSRNQTEVKALFVCIERVDVLAHRGPVEG